MAIDQQHSIQKSIPGELNLDWVRQQFPALHREINGRPVVYLDSAATYLTPSAVIDAVTECYRTYPGTVGRGVHWLNTEATQKYASARQTIADFINAEPDEVVFVRNATEAINLVANGLPPQSNVFASVGEHHSNLLPWRTRHLFTQVNSRPDGSIDLEHLEAESRRSRPALIACSTITNAVGAVNPIAQVSRIARAHDADVFLDASQSAGHEEIDVRRLDCDFLCFSSHKIGGPSGIGILYGKRQKLQDLRPTLIGGGAVGEVTEDGHTLADLPERFESGTPAFEPAIGFAAACTFVDSLGRDSIFAHERSLIQYMLEQLAAIHRVNVVGPGRASDRGSIVAFHVDGIEAHGAARMLCARNNVCLRSGFHCAQPAHQTHSWRPTIRASLGVYNSRADIDTLIRSLRAIVDNLF